MSYQINIGLPADYSGLDIDWILAALPAAGLTRHRFEIHGACLVAEVTVNGCFIAPEDVFSRLAKSLEREAIAVWHCQLHTGHLYGPQTPAYGPFELSKFVRLSGGEGVAH